MSSGIRRCILEYAQQYYLWYTLLHSHDATAVYVAKGFYDQQSRNPKRRDSVPAKMLRCGPQGYAEMASLLLSKGANAGATTLRHLTPLHLASHQGHLKVARILLEAWAPVDDRDQAGTSPLHLSAQKGHTDVVRLLLQCGADKDGLDESGWTPLFFASWKGHEAVVRMLLQAGANARVRL